MKPARRQRNAAKPAPRKRAPSRTMRVAGDKTPARVLDMQAFFKAHA